MPAAAAQQAPKRAPRGNGGKGQAEKHPENKKSAKEALNNLPQAAGMAIMALFLVLALFAGNFRALQIASPKAFIRWGDVQSIVEDRVDAGENILSVAIVSGLKNTENLIKAIQAGEVHYDFVEVMACEGGCIAGGGQPFVIGRAKEERSAGIYEADRMSGVRMSADNPVTEALYKNLLTVKAAHHLLHYK